MQKNSEIVCNLAIFYYLCTKGAKHNNKITKLV